jgi:hypothetical protein
MNQIASRYLLNELPPNVKVKLRRSAQPKWVAPMLATLVNEPFSRAGWLFEPKLDGERCLALRSWPDIQLLSRNQKLLNDKYPELVRAFRDQGAERFAVDCEIVTFDGNAPASRGFNSACRSGIHPRNSAVKSRPIRSTTTVALLPEYCRTCEAVRWPWNATPTESTSRAFSIGWCRLTTLTGSGQ